MAVHIGRRLEEAHRGQVVGVERVEKVMDVILVIRAECPRRCRTGWAVRWDGHESDSR